MTAARKADLCVMSDTPVFVGGVARVEIDRESSPYAPPEIPSAQHGRCVVYDAAEYAWEVLEELADLRGIRTKKRHACVQEALERAFRAGQLAGRYARGA